VQFLVLSCCWLLFHLLIWLQQGTQNVIVQWIMLWQVWQSFLLCNEVMCAICGLVGHLAESTWAVMSSSLRWASELNVVQSFVQVCCRKEPLHPVSARKSYKMCRHAMMQPGWLHWNTSYQTIIRLLHLIKGVSKNGLPTWDGKGLFAEIIKILIRKVWQVISTVFQLMECK